MKNFLLRPADDLSFSPSHSSIGGSIHSTFLRSLLFNRHGEASRRPNSSSHGNNYRGCFRSQPHFSSEKLKNYEKRVERLSSYSLVNVNLPFQSPFSSKPVFCKQKIAQKAQHVRNTSKLPFATRPLPKIHSLKFRHVPCSM